MIWIMIMMIWIIIMIAECQAISMQQQNEFHLQPILQIPRCPMCDTCKPPPSLISILLISSKIYHPLGIRHWAGHACSHTLWDTFRDNLGLGATPINGMTRDSQGSHAHHRRICSLK